MIQKIAKTVVAFIGLVLCLGLVLPRSWSVEQSIVIEASPNRIYPFLFDLKRWQEWSVWTRTMDPLVRHTYEGPQDGIGARWLWLGPQMGRGQVAIVAADPQRGVELEQAIESDDVNAHASLHFERAGTGTRLTWVDKGTLPLLVGGLFKSSVEERLAAHFSTGLKKLKGVVEALPEPAAPGPAAFDGGIN